MQRQPDRPEARPHNRDRHQINKGPLIFREQQPYDPLKDEPTKMLTHRGGIGDARTEHY